MTDLDELYILYFRDVYLFVKGLSADDDLSEEITQETFFKAINNIDSFKGECDIRVWLCQIAKNSFYTYCKKKKINSACLSPQELKNGAGEDSIAEKLIDGESAFEIHEFLHKMEEPYKEVFSLRVFGELSFAQIGKIFSKTESWARVTFHRAKIKIINYMQAQEK